MNKHNWNNAFPDTPQSFKNKINDTLNNLVDKEEIGYMENKREYKKISVKRKMVATIAAVMTIGTTVFAAGKIVSMTSISSNIPTYTKLPSVEVINNDLGFSPKLIDKFENGYTFKNGYISNNEGYDDKGNPVDKSKELSFEYNKENDRLSLSMGSKVLGDTSGEEKVIDTYKDIKIYNNSYVNKVVPGDYKMTEQDKKDEASGKYVFSFGSDKEEVYTIKSISWKQEGINYSFLATNSSLSEGELVKMAQEIIDTK